jgi:hypothetical protein
MQVRTWGIAIAAMFLATAVWAGNPQEGTFGPDQILADLNKAHAALDSGDTAGAKAALKELSAKLAANPSAQNKTIRRKVQFIQLNLLIGNRRGAEERLHGLISEVAELANPGSGAGNDPAPPSPKATTAPKAGTLDHPWRYQEGYNRGYWHGYDDGRHHSYNPYHDPAFWTWDRVFRQGYLDGYNAGYRRGSWGHHNPPGHGGWPWPRY